MVPTGVPAATGTGASSASGLFGSSTASGGLFGASSGGAGALEMWRLAFLMSDEVCWYLFNKGVWASGCSRSVWNIGGYFYIAWLQCERCPHTTGKTMSQVACFGGSSASSGSIGGSYKQQLCRSWGAAWISECGHFTHTELLYPYPHRMMLEDWKRIARCSESPQIKAEIVTAKV